MPDGPSIPIRIACSFDLRITVRWLWLRPVGDMNIRKLSKDTPFESGQDGWKIANIGTGLKCPLLPTGTEVLAIYVRPLRERYAIRGAQVGVALDTCKFQLLAGRNHGRTHTMCLDTVA